MKTRVLVPGEARGSLLRLTEPLSLWGGFDPNTGLVIDSSHPEVRISLTGRIVVMAHGRGSSSSSSVLAEALRLDTGPAGLVLDELDSIFVIGVLVAKYLYEVTCPVLVGQLPESAVGVWRIALDGIVRPQTV